MNKQSSKILVDYTKARLHSKSYRGRPIEKCPECGRKGERSRYQSGGEIYVHNTVMGMWAAMVGEHHTIGRIA